MYVAIAHHHVGAVVVGDDLTAIGKIGHDQIGRPGIMDNQADEFAIDGAVANVKRQTAFRC